LKDQTTSKTYTSFTYNSNATVQPYCSGTISSLLQTLSAPKQCILVDVAFIDLNHLHILTIFSFVNL
ncbi:hypothetical protein, partial [Acinetobacter nosocomialis]|uniref:hypothetical protein n=1 Tax=Acinetobacter nosocomialis TaxID=106654 RepID=UPI00374EDCF1